MRVSENPPRQRARPPTAEGAPAPPIGPEQRTAYTDALRALRGAGTEFLVGGGFAMHQYLQRWRSTKDLDLFVRARDVRKALMALEHAGFRAELTDPAWLGKAVRDDILVDLIFSSYNGLFPVDDQWFANRRESTVLGEPVSLVGPEEMIVSKAFVAARDRFDGSDISWLIRTLGPGLDWKRIERLMHDHWEVLLWQLVHYRYVFPEDREKVPGQLVGRLLGRMFDELRDGTHPPGVTCRGPMFDAIHYLAAILEKERNDPVGRGASDFLGAEAPQR